MTAAAYLAGEVKLPEAKSQYRRFINGVSFPFFEINQGF
jgi:hypothetical protein